MRYHIPKSFEFTLKKNQVKANRIRSTAITYSITEEQIKGSYFLLGYTNRAFVNRSWGLRQMKESRKDITRELNFQYEEFLVAPSWTLAIVLGVVSVVVGTLFVYASLVKTIHVLQESC